MLKICRRQPCLPDSRIGMRQFSRQAGSARLPSILNYPSYRKNTPPHGRGMAETSKLAPNCCRISTYGCSYCPRHVGIEQVRTYFSGLYISATQREPHTMLGTSAAKAVKSTKSLYSSRSPGLVPITEVLHRRQMGALRQPEGRAANLPPSVASSLRKGFLTWLLRHPLATRPPPQRNQLRPRQVPAKCRSYSI